MTPTDRLALLAQAVLMWLADNVRVWRPLAWALLAAIVVTAAYLAVLAYFDE